MADTEAPAAAAAAATAAKPEEVEEPTTKGEGEEGGEEEATYESTAVFQPVVQLQEVETKTHEEEEDVIYKQHRQNGRTRVLMRQEKTMKVIANHVVDPRITLTPNVGSDKSWVWTAFDYSEGELREEVFALKFGKAEDANEFKKCFEVAKEEMKALVPVEDEEPAGEGDSKAAEDASDALSSLNLKNKEDSKGGAADPPAAGTVTD